MTRFQAIVSSPTLKLLTSKRALARILSTFLCSLAVVIRPFSVLGGRYAFLVVTVKELVFSVQTNLAQQLELTVLNLLGAFAGIGFSTIAKYIASLYPIDDPRGRATCATTLISISFFAGLIKSRLPRLTLSMRISCFISVWLLTADIGVHSRVLADSGNFLWVAVSAATICLISLLIVMILFQFTPTSFEREIAHTFSLIHQSLSLALNMTFHAYNEQSAKDEYKRLHSEILQRSISLSESYSQAAFELKVGHLSLKSIQPLISIIEHLRRELAWGLSPTNSLTSNASEEPDLSPEQRDREVAFSQSLIHPTVVLGKSLLDSMAAIEATVQLVFHPNPSSHKLTVVDNASVAPEETVTLGRQSILIRDVENQLFVASEILRKTLQEATRTMRLEESMIVEFNDHRRDILDGSLAVVSLLQMTHQTRLALKIAEHLITEYKTSKTRLWYPSVSLAWLGVAPCPSISDDPSTFLVPNTLQEQLVSASDSPSNPALASSFESTNLSSSERRQGLAEQALRLSSFKTYSLSQEGGHVSFYTRLENSISILLSWIWNNDTSLKLRLWSWKIHRKVKHSRHLRHALKNAIGVALLTFPAFMPIGTGGRDWYSKYHGQWMTISYLWVLETNTGATWRTGYLRILGTILGALYAYITWLICHTNPYGLVVMVTFFDVPATWLILAANLGPLAVPASIALPPIAFAQYISPDPAQSVFNLALFRAIMITLGMVAALLMNSLVFPRHCRVLFLSDTSHTLELLSNLYQTLSGDMLLNKQHGKDARLHKLELELDARNALHRLLALITTMRNELGLLPKPIRHYRSVVAVLQRLLDLLTGLRKVRENIPRKETVSDVFKERQEFMSCVCIALFACQHAFRTREPLPQFLPSARHAFSSLERHSYKSIRRTRENDPNALGLHLIYAFAEQEILRDLVDVLEDLLSLTGKLFGASEWLMQNHASAASPDTASMDARMRLRRQDTQGWYTTSKWDEV
ncbi:hypothetical protein C8Q75DRAFT_709584 [Abortiporus biennis]|nr:hypothetical protein C8Q75DRAFT_709584 [Abortiporus biennis]